MFSFCAWEFAGKTNLIESLAKFRKTFFQWRIDFDRKAKPGIIASGMGKALNIFLLYLLFSVQVVIAANPVELVLDKQSEELPDNNRIHDVQFGTNGSIAVIGSQGRRLEVWNIGGGEENRSFKAALLDVKSAKWVGSGHTILISSPLWVTIWNAEKVEPINEVQTGCLDGWPIAILPSGLSAWEDVEGGKALVTVQNLVKPDKQIRLNLGEDRVYALDLSPDGKYLAAAVNQPRIRLWSLATGGELPLLPLQFGSGGGPFIPSDKMIAMQPGAATTVRFSRDSRLLAAGNELAIHVWEIQNGHKPLLLRGPETGIGELVFGPDSSHLYASYWDATVRQWRID